MTSIAISAGIGYSSSRNGEQVTISQGGAGSSGLVRWAGQPIDGINVWHALVSDPEDFPARQVRMAWDDGDVLLVAGASNRVFVSNDRGEQWGELLPRPTFNGELADELAECNLVFDPKTGRYVVMLMERYPNRIIPAHYSFAASPARDLDITMDGSFREMTNLSILLQRVPTTTLENVAAFAWNEAGSSGWAIQTVVDVSFANDTRVGTTDQNGATALSFSCSKQSVSEFVTLLTLDNGVCMGSNQGLGGPLIVQTNSPAANLIVSTPPESQDSTQVLAATVDTLYVVTPQTDGNGAFTPTTLGFSRFWRTLAISHGTSAMLIDNGGFTIWTPNYSSDAWAPLLNHQGERLEPGGDVPDGGSGKTMSTAALTGIVIGAISAVAIALGLGLGLGLRKKVAK